MFWGKIFHGIEFRIKMGRGGLRDELLGRTWTGVEGCILLPQISWVTRPYLLLRNWSSVGTWRKQACPHSCISQILARLRAVGCDHPSAGGCNGPPGHFSTSAERRANCCREDSQKCSSPFPGDANAVVVGTLDGYDGMSACGHEHS